MKSMLQEASSVLKAIEKAWQNAGKPHEFTIRIMEVEEKNFLGKSSKPAVVSIAYEPKRAPMRAKERAPEKVVAVKQKIERESKKTTGFFRSLFERLGKKEEVVQKPQMERRLVGHRKEGRPGWSRELVNDAVSWLREILHIMGRPMGLNFKVDQRMLSIFLDRRILKEADEEKMFFISISHLIMQFLKKKYKRKLQNYHLIIYSKTETNGANQQDTSNK